MLCFGDIAASRVNSDHTVHLNYQYGTHQKRDERKSERNVFCQRRCSRQPQHQNQTYRSRIKVSFWFQSFSTVVNFFVVSKGRSIGSQNVGFQIIMDCLLQLFFVFSCSVVIESLESFKFASLEAAIISLLRFLRYYNNIRDFKIRNGEVLLRLREVKLTSGDVSTCVEERLSGRRGRSMIFYYGTVFRLGQSSLREYKISFPCHFHDFFSFFTSQVLR